MKITIKLIEQIIEDGSHLLCPVFLNNRAGIMVIDTGASASIFDEKRILNYIASETVKTVNDKVSSGLGVDTIRVSEFTLDKLQLGELRLYGLKFSALKLDSINRAYLKLGYQPIEGIIGADLLRRFKAVIDYDNKSLILTI